MVDTVLTLVVEERYRDKTGVYRTKAVSKREIFAQISSINRQEFFSAGQAGFRPEHQFTVFAAEYHGEELCEYDGAAYVIYRSYHVPGTDYLELYVQKKAGVTNGAQG